MLTSADKVGGWVLKDQKHADVILEWSLKEAYLVSDHAENPDQSANQTGNCLNHSQGSLSNKSCVHLGHYTVMRFA